MAENLLMSQILRLLATLIKYGYYDDPVDVHSPLQQIFKILEYSPPSKSKSKSTKTIIIKHVRRHSVALVVASLALIFSLQTFSSMSVKTLAAFIILLLLGQFTQQSCPLTECSVIA